MITERDFIVFYSWQSDLPVNTNLKAIRNGLRSASALIEEQTNIKVIIDEATRGKSGSPNIPATIMDKIKSCDLFICDLTTINSTSDIQYKRTPNPNVLFELGYAVAMLGWDRIVMLFNKEFGSFPNDLPFDIDRHRASPYVLSEKDAKNKSNISNLNKLLQDAINAVIINCPIKPAEIINKTPAEIKKHRDIDNIKQVFSCIHLPTIDHMILELPRSLHNRAIYFWEAFNGSVTNSLFHLYDEEVNQLIQTIYVNWSECLKYGTYYRSIPGQEINIFSNPGDAPLNESQEKAWKAIDKSRSKLRSAIDKVINHIRYNYIEIDINDLTKIAWQTYIQDQRDLQKIFE